MGHIHMYIKWKMIIKTLNTRASTFATKNIWSYGNNVFKPVFTTKRNKSYSKSYFIFNPWLKLLISR